MANHSCTPNAVQSFEFNGRICFRAVAPISPGQEVTISYIELAAARPERREALLTSYYFDIDQVGSVSTLHVLMSIQHDVGAQVVRRLCRCVWEEGVVGRVGVACKLFAPERVLFVCLHMVAQEWEAGTRIIRPCVGS